MKKAVCFYFQVHQPTRLRQYRFFDIGKDSHYYDDFANRTILKRISKKCYLPMNELLLEQIKACKGKFKVAFSISGTALEQFNRYEPEVLESFRKLVDTGCVEILGETYYHSLSAIRSEGEFTHQVRKHTDAVKDYFGVTPKVFRNTELIYSDKIGALASKLGFNTILTEGARHIMGWKSPDYIYTNESVPAQKVLLRNYGLSDDIAFRFADSSWQGWPLTAEKFADWVDALEGDIVNLFMDYETFGEHLNKDSGIFDFMKALPKELLGRGNVRFVTPSEASETIKAVAPISVPEPISWADEERDLSAWLGNELQQDAFNKIYSLSEKLAILNDHQLWNDYGHLQESDHFYYLSTKFFSDGEIHSRFNPYDTPFEAFINYMNVVSDFIIRVNNRLAEKQ